MATEVLAVPECRLLEVIAVIRAGLKTETVYEETRDQLTRWCNEEFAYMAGGEEGEVVDGQG